MPIYEYRCPDGHDFEVFQSMADDPVSACEVCGKPVERIFSPVAVHYKGSGFYTTDYAKKGSAKAAGDGGDASKSDKSKADSSSDSKSSSDSGSKSSGAETKTKTSSSD